MRLTNADREAFVRAAMDDAPKIDYSTQCKEIILGFLKETVPIDLQNMIAKYPDWFDAHRVSMPMHIEDFNTRLTPKYREWNHILTDEERRNRVRELAAAAKLQSEQRAAIEIKLTSVIASCTTLKMAKEILPEFVKYLPQERDGKVIRSMPVVANLVADLMSMGWPKDKQSAQTAAG